MPGWCRALFLLALAGAAAPAPARATGTIILLRHAEKPAQGLGQLDCQGLNRALALPAVIFAKFGRPDAVIAPDPAQRKPDHGVAYDYVRPLATIEPIAVAAGLPVEADIGYADVEALRRRLERADLAGKRVLVGWEHRELVKLARTLMTDHGGNAAIVPDWPDDDFDRIYVVTIEADGRHATFRREQEGLNGQSQACPGPAARP